MKHLFLIISVFLISYYGDAQKFSCGNPGRFNANYTSMQGPLELVSITLQQDKTAKTAADKERSIASATYYAASGAVSSSQFTSVEANIGFGYCTQAPVFELYKADVKNGMRTFTIPAGTNGNHSVNIPIQVVYPLGWSPNTRNQNGFIQIKFTNGYLAAGEYVLIDKSSLTSDGSQVKGVAFSIK